MIRCVLCLFFSIQLVRALDLKQNVILIREKRRSEDGWRFVDQTNPTPRHYDDRRLQSSTESSIIADRKNGGGVTNNTCQPYEPKKPNFFARNRKISEIKCYEYIWEIKNREEKEKRIDECTDESLRKSSAFVLVGRATKLGEFPHMAAIGWKATTGTWIFKCGGSLISSKFVLTAGHCIKASSLDTSVADTVPKIVRLGDKNIADTFQNGVNPVDVNISKIIPHPLYSPPKKYNDIALFELENEMEFTKLVHPACLWTKFDVRRFTSKGTVTGWGVVISGRLETSPELQAAEVDIIDSDFCDQLLLSGCNRHWCGLEEHQICAGTLAGGADTCQGDSGGPLQLKIHLPSTTKGTIHHVVGITSFGYQCGRPNSPGIYTRVSSFLDWIENVVWPEDIKRNNSY